MDGAYIALRGYKYQFDRTIVEIFNNPNGEVEIEQLQDYGYNDYLVQVKYHNTDYTAAQQNQKVKKPLVFLFEQFLKHKAKKFILFIYLKGVAPSKKTLTIDELDAFLGKTTKFSAAEKAEFIKAFTLIHAEDFETQYKELIGKIKTAYSKTEEEAEIYYSVISSHLLEIVTKNSPASVANRKTSKKEIDKIIINGKKLIFKSAYVEIVSKEKQLKSLNKLFFKTSLNSEPFERIFIFQINKPVKLSDLKELVLAVKTKWSKNKIKSIPDNDRFVPYIFFQDIDAKDLVRLKLELQKDDYIICDGYDFMDAPFDIKSIKKRPTFSNGLFFKLINKQQDLEKLVSSLDRTGEIFHFFFNEPVRIPFEGKYIEIEIQEFTDIKNII
jgi:hypothetical protein